MYRVHALLAKGEYNYIVLLNIILQHVLFSAQVDKTSKIDELRQFPTPAMDFHPTLIY